MVVSKSTVVVQTAGESESEMPEEYALDQNYPNLFNPSTIFAFRLPATGDVSLNVYNILGQEVATLTEGPFAAGVHRIEWDGRDSAGSAVASGVYLIRMQAGRFRQVQKAVLLR
ncbi:MAG TPA: FlgD immunoglobulin-like domain containing protein [Rhodothermales bacterium]|nr:FlgD immunoglobulin-like domain containing protein [Rhodothermales bacterium]